MKRTRGLAGNQVLPGLCALLLCGACSGANTDPPEDLVQDAAAAEKPDARGGMDQARGGADQGGARGPLLINEVAPHGSEPDTDPDFIELYNSGSGQVNLRGYKVRDDSDTWIELPEADFIPAGGYYIINCDDMSATSKLPGAHVPFKLGGGGDEAHLAAPDGTELDSVRWGSGIIELPKGQALGRKPDAAGPFVLLEKSTRGRPNS